MSWYTDWFLAEETEAAAVASIGSDDDDAHDFDDWPHLAMKSIGEMELMRLWGVLRGEPARMDSVSGEALFTGGDGAEDEGGNEEEYEADEGGVVVSRVLPEFITALSRLTEAEIDRCAHIWHASEEMADWKPDDVAAQLREMAEFARRARCEDKPVLQLVVW
jgi:hypothetical protein